MERVVEEILDVLPADDGVTLSNIWPTVLGLSRTTATAILQKHDPSRVAEDLAVSGLLDLEQSKVLIQGQSRFANAFEDCVTLAYCSDCLDSLCYPVFTYLNSGGSWRTLNLSPLMCFLKPAAHYFAGTKNSTYQTTANLTTRLGPGFIYNWSRDTDLFGQSCERTKWMSLRLSLYATELLNNRALLDDYHCVITSLFHKTASLVNTQRESQEFLESIEKHFAILSNWHDENVKVVASTSPIPLQGSSGIPTTNGEEHQNVLPASSNKRPDQVLEAALAELDSLIGLPKVKEEVKKLTAFLTIQKERRKHGLRESSQTLHFVFTGNPGTGKTTVARIIAKILFGFELLKSSKLVETDRSNLIGGFLGQTAIKTDEVIKSAIDGVLFIDEAYTLASDAAKFGYGDMYGEEAISTLLKRMEDNRDRLSVIVAGYPALMEKFLQTNPGLSSRFTQHIHFDDYSVADLGRIFLKFCRDAEYVVNSRCLVVLSFLLGLAYHRRGDDFGNARFVRNAFEEVTVRHSQRLIAAGQHMDKEKLMQLDPSDLMVGPLAGITPTLFTLENLKWKCNCPQCCAGHKGGINHLGRQINCVKCGKPFAFDFWNPILETLTLS